MKRIIMFVLTVGAGALAGTVNFDEMQTGAAPAGWSATKTGKGDPQWMDARRRQFVRITPKAPKLFLRGRWV